MTGKGLADGLKSYVGALLTVVLFPLFWLRSVKLARRHADVDPRGVAKVGLAIVLSVAILAGGAFVLLGFQSGAQHSMYVKSLETRVATAVGEKAYNDNVAAVTAADVALPIIERNLANATRDNNTAKAAELQAALDATRKARNEADAKVTLYTPNHDLFGRLVPAIEAEDDALIRSMLAQDPLALPEDMDAHVDDALALKDRAVSDMHLSMWLFVWPSLAGAFLAPVVFAVGSILRKAFVPSDSVGFKPYPGAAAGFFLLFGAFGVPSIPFAAWTYMDLESRSREGQISL
ncbi:MAG: hypothetical protein WC876_06325 [Candidatus Thermoplasmatota archaeon]|jgi:hypothetical protein